MIWPFLAGTKVTGGQTIMNPSPIIGGVAMSVVKDSEFIRPCSASVGDVLVLTKPIGTQIAVNLFEWFNMKKENFFKLSPQPTESQVFEIFNKACSYMGSLNKTAAKLMHKYFAKACTDVTGFGLLGHASNLAAIQHSPVDFKITSLPIIAGVHNLDKQARNFRLVEGYSAETSGGLLIVLPADSVSGFLSEFSQLENREAWVIGEVVEGLRTAKIDNPQIIEV